ncbi:MAG: TIGR01777 family oxidoreductase [Polyangia bacterium]|jgi:uncharacterized protein (TIGR01777 family)|nr:TIGR01777 family oxidoreductase [Polyangia bacterium]
MRVLVTGATGFVGKSLVEELGKRGHEVWALSRSPEAARAALPGLGRAFPLESPEDGQGPGRRAGPGSGTGPASGPPPEALEGVESVINLAGEPVAGRWTKAKRQAIHQSRVKFTSLLVRAMAETPTRPRRLVSASAIGFYGDRGDEVLSEPSGPGSGFLSEVCQAWETSALEAEPLGVEVTRIRIGIVLGPEGGALARMLPLYRKGLGGRLGSGRQWWSWIHRDDLVALLAWAATVEAAPPPVMNAVAPDPRPQAEFSRALASALGRGLFLPAPAFAIRAALGGFSEELLTSKRCLPDAALAAGAPILHGRLEEALADLVGARTS